MTEKILLHPLAEVFPEMTPDEYAALVADVRKYGIREPVTIYQDKILDGRHRYRASEETGHMCRFTEFEGDDEAALAFVISTNLYRRHLSTGQRAMIAAKMANIPLGGNQHNSGCLNSGTQPIGQAQAAKALDVGRDSVQKAKQIQEKAPELAKKVESGEMKLNEAINEVRAAEAPPPKQYAPSGWISAMQNYSGIKMQWGGSQRRTIEAAFGIELKGKTFETEKEAIDFACRAAGLFVKKDEIQAERATFPKTAQDRFDRLLAMATTQMKAELEQKYWVDVNAKALEVMPDRMKKIEKENKEVQHALNAFRRGPGACITKDEYRRVSGLMHPDTTPTPTDRAEGFNIIRKLDPYMKNADKLQTIVLTK